MELAVEVTLLYAGCCLGYGSPKTLLATSLGLKQTEPPQARTSAQFSAAQFSARNSARNSRRAILRALL